MTGGATPSYSWRRIFPIPATFDHGISGCLALKVVAKMPAGRGNDFDPALHQPAFAPVGFEGVDRHARHFASDAPDRLEDVAQPRRE